MTSTIVTFTQNSFQEIVDHQGDWDWVLNESRAKSCHYLVCCHSGGEKKGHAFLVGKISGVRPSRFDSNSGKQRWLIQFSEYASIDLPNAWGGWQNPVRYTNLEDLGINLLDLDFQKVSTRKEESEPFSLTIAQAKAGLARQYDVEPDNIEILIKG